MLIVLLRNTENWGDLNYERFVNQEQKARFENIHYSPKNTQKFFSGIREWNKIMPINFFRFRQKLKEISQTTLEPYKTFNHIPTLMDNLQDKDVVVPVDDDDWLAPDLEQVLSYFEGFDFVIWNQIAFESLNKQQFRLWSGNGVGTCAYAISGKALKRLSKYHLDVALRKHYSVHRVMAEARWQGRFIGDKHWSCYNRHPAGMTSLIHRDYRKFKLVKPKNIKFTWLKPLVDKYNQLLQFLEQPDILV